VAEFAGADRCRLIVLASESQRPLGVYDWSAPGVAPEMPEMGECGPERFPWSSAALARGEVVQIDSAQSLPPEAAAERGDLLARGVRSLLGVPVRSGETVIGFQIFESLTAPRHWSERLLGRMPAAVVGRMVRELTHPDDFEALRRVVVETMRQQSEIRVVLRMRHRDGSWRWLESAGRAYRTATGDVRLLSTIQDITERVAAERAVVGARADRGSHAPLRVDRLASAGCGARAPRPRPSRCPLVAGDSRSHR